MNEILSSCQIAPESILFKKDTSQPILFEFYHSGCRFLDAKLFLKCDSFYQIAKEFPEIQKNYPNITNLWLPCKFQTPNLWNRIIEWPMLQDFYEHHDSIQARVQKSNYHSHLITTKPQFDVTAEIISTIEGQTKLLALACIIYCTKGILLEKNVMQVFNLYRVTKRHRKNKKSRKFKHIYNRVTLSGYAYESLTRHILPKYELFPLMNPNGFHR